MRPSWLLVVVAASLLAIAAAGPVVVSFADGPAPGSPSVNRAAAPGCESSVTLVSDTENGTVLRFATIASPSTGPRPEEGTPVVAYTQAAERRGGPTVWHAAAPRPARFSALLRVPDTGAITAEISDVEFRPIGPEPPRAPADPATVDPSRLVDVSDPAIVRGVRVARVTVSPFARLAEASVVATTLTVRITAAPRPGVNERTRRRPPSSAAYRRILDRVLINGAPGGEPPAAAARPGGNGSPDGAEYLLIVPDGFESAIDPLVDWKEKKGITCRVAPTSEVGLTTQEIRGFISDAYFEWDVPPEYVLLAGDSEQIPVHDGLALTDNFYAAIDGADYLADLLIGRLPAETVDQCAYLAAKAVAYERANVSVGAHWPASASLFVHEDGDYSDAVYYANTEFVRGLMDSAAFAPIDTLFADANGAGATQAEVMAVMNEGRGFVNFRGSAYAIWPAPFALYPPNLTNGWNQPVVMSATCATVGYDADHYLSHSLMRAGSIGDPKGAAAFVGTTTAGMGLDWKRGYVDEGFFAHAFGGGLTLGEALEAGKLSLFYMEEDRQEYEGWAIMGDPELNLWTAPRRSLEVAHDDMIQAGPIDFVVSVSEGAAPVAGARVACAKEPEVHVSGFTDSSGRAIVSLETSSAGTLHVVVTSRNAIPYQSSVEVIDTGPFIVFEAIEIDDHNGGNGDGLVSPGESADLALTLLNTGDQAAVAVTATLRTADEHVTIVDSVAAYGSVPAGVTATGDRPYRIGVDEGRRRDTPLELAVLMEYDEWTRLSLLPPIDVAAGDLVVSAVVFDDRPPGGNGDGVADLGESGAIAVELRNDGGCGLTSIAATLSSPVASIAVLAGGTSFADAPAGSLATGSGSPAVISIAPEAPTAEVALLSLALSAAGHSYAYAETLSVPVTIEDAPTTLASGPDAYGYYAFDSSDTNYGAHPSFEWIDITPPGPGEHVRYVSSGDERMKLETLPFSFTYYGYYESHISIGSNGVIAFGASSYVFGDNSGIPDVHGPEAMVAPFWDDLNPGAGGDVYQWFDVQNHRYVVQYEEVLRDGSDAAETFQVILMDPAYHPTPTGDGAIVMQYESVSETDQCTIGIENRQQDDGIEYCFDGSYDPHAAPLTGGLAILFTTEPPSSPDAPWLLIRGALLDDSEGGNGNGVAEPGETVSLVFELENAGPADAIELDLTLSVEDSTIVIIDGASAMDDLPAGGVASNESDPFSTAVAADAGEGAVPLWVMLGGTAGETQSALRYDLPIAVPDDAVAALALAPCHPNPFTDGTAFRLHLPESVRATHRVLVRVYNVAGRLVATPFDGELPPGSHDISWDGKGADGTRAASGVYFVRADTAGSTRTRKAVLLR